MSDGLSKFARRLAGAAFIAILLGSAEGAVAEATKGAVNGRARSADGVEIAYTARGAGNLALVFIHGGLADRTFWAPQLDGLADRFRVVALDLAGHGESGRGRKAYTTGAWGEDVRAVVNALHLDRVVLIGNSLGGAVALEAARLLRGRVLGVVGVDTLHDLTYTVDAAAAHARAEAFRTDFAATCRAMVSSLFHPGMQPELQAWAERKMCATPPEVVVSMMEGFAGYDTAAAARAAGVPIRAINGDLWPIRTDVNRTVVKDFDAAVMKDAGHYPMLEHPKEFNRILAETIRALELDTTRRDPTGS
jgi:pimeloyl-ACP methyl ester carboxylesterase